MTSEAITPGRQLYLQRQILVNLIYVAGAEIYPADLIVDSGCGNAPHIHVLNYLCGPRTRIVALDHRRESLGAVKRKTRAWGFNNIDLIKSKIEDMDTVLGIAVADLVLCASVLQFTDLAMATRAIANATKDGGMVVLSVPMGLSGIMEENPQGFYKDFQYALREEMLRAVRKNGSLSQYGEGNILRQLPDRRFETFSSAIEASGFEIVHHNIATQIVAASRLVDHLNVRWRAEKLLPGADHIDAVNCIRRAVKRTMKRLFVKPDHPFYREIHYATAKRKPRLSAH